MFDTTGHEVHRNCINPDHIFRIRQSMMNIMAQFCDVDVNNPNCLDDAFKEITAKGGNLRGNVFKVFSNIADIPLILGESHVQEQLKNFGFKVPVLQSFNMIAMEPGQNRFLFHRHQDLQSHISFHSVNLWIPLSNGENIGGMGLYDGTYKLGPLSHITAMDGHLEIPEERFEGNKSTELTDLKIGDIAYFNPYSVHWSIANSGSNIRWTLAISIDDGAKASHLSRSRSPYNPADFVDTRTNEQRLIEADEGRKSNENIKAK